MLTYGFWSKPSDGAMGWRRMASVVVLSKYVTSRLTRSSSSPASKPISTSVPRSGLSSVLPGSCGVTPGFTVPSLYSTNGEVLYVASAPLVGERPVVPYAPRTRNVLIRSPRAEFCQKPSSDST